MSSTGRKHPKARVPRTLVRTVPLLLALTSVSAQELTSVQVSRNEIGIGEGFELQLHLKKIDNSNQTVCNLVVDFGDGRTEQVRITAPRYVVDLSHSYKRPGTAVIQVYGKTRFQGLQTAFGCFGDRQTVAVNVLPEDFAVRRAAALAEKEAALQRAEAEREAARLAATEAQKQRSAAQQAAEQARVERATAERIAKDAARQRAAVQRDAKKQASSASRGAPQIVPAPEVKSAAPPPTAATPDKTRTAPPRAKSSLDL